MGDAIQHRGPDSHGQWQDIAAGIALSHQRLAILDLSVEGHQPMVSNNGSLVISFNGEIYNFKEIKKQLISEGVNDWRGTSDTEVLLAAISKWGVKRAVEMANGMFAFAVWNRQSNQLTLVRDRLGKKPLYFGWLAGGGFLFGSELKCFCQHERFEKKVNRQSLHQFMRYAYVPEPQCIYENTYKLPAGSILTLNSNAARVPLSYADVQQRIEPYWSVAEIADRGQRNLFTGGDSEAINTLEGLLEQAVERRMFSDVPLGAFLSGGIDSSLIVAMMRKYSPSKVKTFTIGYEDKQYSEAIHARAIAQHLDTDHTELIVSPADAMAVIPKLAAMYDEPFADASQIPTFLVAQLARQSVTVVLSGDGGDEVFGGYNRYLQAPGLWAKINRIPRPLRTTLAGALGLLSPASWDRIYELGPWRKRHAMFGDQLQKIANVLPSRNASLLYRSLCSQWQNPGEVVIGARDDATYDGGSDGPVTTDRSFAQWMKMRDLQTYLTGDILTKVDRATMAISLEARAPLLDYQLIEWAWSLPIEMNIRNGVGKWILRQVLDKYVPRPLIDRPKMGFGIPVVHWLRNELKDWASDLLDEKRLRKEGYFHPKPIAKLWQQHLSGARNSQQQLWTILMFQAWLEHQSHTVPTPSLSI